MNIYFSAAIYQKGQFGEAYKRIVETLVSAGHVVFQDTTTTTLGEALEKDDSQRIEYYRKVLKWIAKSEVVVLEVSFPSTLHIGHEISLALEKGKPVVGLYQKGFEPSFFLGLEDEKLVWVEYELDKLKNEIENALELATEKMDTRFNFFISPKHQRYLDWVSKHKKVPRAVFLRRLIEEDMQKNPDFS
jgi:hypothetical protein